METFDLLMEDAKLICKKINFNMLNNKTVIITGATGLVGLRLVSTIYYLNEFCGKKIHLYTSSKNHISDEFELLFKQKNIFHFHGDLTSSRVINLLPNADFIIHCSGYGQPTKFLHDKIKTIELNTVITDCLLQKLNPEGKFLFISSSEVYSGNPSVPYQESDVGYTNTNHPRACYIESKKLGETICNIYRQNGLDIKSARLCLAYGGATLNDTRVINSFVKKALAGKIELLDLGLAIRTYCDVIDAVVMMWNILLNGKSDIYNVGGKDTISIKDLALKIGSIMNVEIIIPEKDDGLFGSPSNVGVDISKYEDEFGKVDFIDLDSGINRLIQWYKALI
jgi:nucleoside-diphosphate-sugar epimerase